MDELTVYMAGAILLLTIVLAGYIVWTSYEISQLRRTEKKIQRLAKAANACVYTVNGDPASDKAWERLIDCLSGLMEDV
jgi:hypothetical protein